MTLEQDVKDIWKKFNANAKQQHKKKYRFYGYDDSSTYMGRLAREKKEREATRTRN